MNKKVISWILVFCWMSFIFFLSSMNADNSTKTSKGFIYSTIGNIIRFSNEIGLSNVQNIDEVVDKLDWPVRKTAHIFEYFVMAILLCYAVKNSGVRPSIKMVIVAVAICCLYACTDEWHQEFVSGRSGRLKDVSIDLGGSIMGSILFLWIWEIRHRDINVLKRNEKKIEKEFK